MTKEMTESKKQEVNKAKAQANFLLLCGALAAGQAAHWFISGEARNHSGLRNWAVLVQLLVGLVVIFYGWRKWKNAA